MGLEIAKANPLSTGLVTMAACTNVQSYAAGQVFLWLGYNGMMYVLQVVMADTSSLKNRAYVFAFSNTPYIVTTFAGPRAAASFIRTSGWPWAYGVFTVVIPLISVPISVVLFLNQRKAFKMGLLTKKEQSGRSFFQSVSYYFWEFDGEYSFVKDYGTSLTRISPCSLFDHSSLCPNPPTFLSSILPGEEMGSSYDHRHVGYWRLLSRSLPNLREVSFAEDLHPLSPLNRQNCHGRLPPFYVPVHQLLVSPLSTHCSSHRINY